jgi:hypothetical protein
VTDTTTLLQADVSEISQLTDDQLLSLANEMLAMQAHDRNVNFLRYYTPVSEKALSFHLLPPSVTVVGVGGGNGSSKTTICLADLVILATGQIPLSLQGIYPIEKFRGPINCRIVVESITTTLHPIILPKLQYWRWQGVDRPGGDRGYYGLVPKHSLLKGEWSESWTERTRTLQVRFCDPISGRPDGISTIQCMSYDQDPSDFASGDFHLIHHDEPPKESIWVENMARTMRVNGRMMVGMTWPDDPTIPVDWILDRIWEKAQPGKNNDPTVAWINLYTTENMNLNQTAIAETARKMTEKERAARIYGQPIRLGNRVHPLFTENEHQWCMVCNDLSILDADSKCGVCGSEDVVAFAHVAPQVANPLNPVICLLDPHPRKAHCLIWVEINANDDLRQIDEMEVDGSPDVVAERVIELEALYGWASIRRIMDPNMGRSPSGTDRETTWQDAFERAGLNFDLADDSDVGRQGLNDYLKPDSMTKEVRYQVDPRCHRTIYQMSRYSWDDYKKSLEKDMKQKPKQKHDDFPTLLKYLVNSNPTFRGCRHLGTSVITAGGRKNGY